MKNMVYFFICNLLLVALFVLSSCAGHEEEPSAISTQSDLPAYGLMTADSSFQNKTQTKESSSARAQMSEKSNNDLLHWSAYSALDGR